jgi:cellulose biosynthesis protein BcsQ
MKVRHELPAHKGYHGKQGWYGYYHDKKVLLIDADPQSSLTASLLKGQNPDQLEMTLTTVMDATIEDRPIS